MTGKLYNGERKKEKRCIQCSMKNKKDTPYYIMGLDNLD